MCTTNALRVPRRMKEENLAAIVLQLVQQTSDMSDQAFKMLRPSMCSPALQNKINYGQVVGVDAHILSAWLDAGCCRTADRGDIIRRQVERQRQARQLHRASSEPLVPERLAGRRICDDTSHLLDDVAVVGAFPINWCVQDRPR